MYYEYRTSDIRVKKEIYATHNKSMIQSMSVASRTQIKAVLLLTSNNLRMVLAAVPDIGR